MTTRTTSTRLIHRLCATATAIVLPVAAVTGGAAGAAGGAAGAAGGARTGSHTGGWASGLWMGAGGTSVGTTIKDVRTIINASTGTAAGLTGAGVGVALIDTGVAPVPGISSAQLVNGPDLSFESQTSNLRYLDTYGHGTHLAGIVIANDAATGTVGLAPKAKLTSIKVGAANGAVDVSQVIAAIDWVVELRGDDTGYPIRVLNLSYGTGGSADYRSDPIQFAIEQAWRAGIVVVVAGGNEGNTSTALTLPATDPFVLAVGATSTKGTTGTLDDTLATFTNLGKARNVDLLAPGDSIVSLRDQGSNIDETYPTARVGDTLFRGSGSSQAAAVTSAAVALLLQNRPGLTPDQVKRLLVDSGTPVQVGTGATVGLRQLNLGGALTRATPTATQTWTRSTGTGLIETARGDSHVIVDNVALHGENSVVGKFTSATWAPAAAVQNSWVGGRWMGSRLAGEQWGGPGGPGSAGQISGTDGLCLDVSGGSTLSGTGIVLWTCHGRSSQYWQLMPDGTAQILGKCLNASSRLDGANVVIWDCATAPNKHWKVNDQRQLVNTESGKCLDTASTTLSGIQVRIAACNTTSNQRFTTPYASKTWSAGTWDGKPWSGAASWSDPNWTGRYWSGRYWSGRYWSGRYWSSEDWSTAVWG